MPPPVYELSRELLLEHVHEDNGHVRDYSLARSESRRFSTGIARSKYQSKTTLLLICKDGDLAPVATRAFSAAAHLPIWMHSEITQKRSKEEEPSVQGTVFWCC